MENNTNNTTVRTTGLGFSSVLALIFITLKLCHVIDWSWVWVLAPIWIPLSIVLAIMIVFIVCQIILKIIIKRKR